jgi:hypothetical protein
MCVNLQQFMPCWQQTSIPVVAEFGGEELACAGANRVGSVTSTARTQ